MEPQTTLPDDLSGLCGGLVLVEAPSGSARREALRLWTGRLGAGGDEALLLPCDFRDGGPWAGVDRWVAAILPALDRRAPELAARHALELSMVLPARKVAFAAPATLTELAEGNEAVRNFALDRAYRVAQGVIDLLDAWYQQAPPPRVVVCDGFDRAGALTRRFFRELLRRRGRSLGITLVVAVNPGAAEETRTGFAAGTPAARVRLDLAPDAPGMSPATAAFGRELRELLDRGEFPGEDRFPELLRYWEEAGGPAEALPAMAYAMGRYNHLGFYEDGLRFLEPALEGIDRIPADHRFLTRWSVVTSIFNCLVALGQVDRAYRVVQEEGLARISDPLDRARGCYMSAMVHARFAAVKDYAAAERFVEQGMRELEEVSPEHPSRHYVHVFLNNALAYIRSRQGKPREAITLCADGHERVRERLGSRKHSLQRSVLLYNIAQVYTATRDYDQAVEYFGRAMELDPNYSEYHNERGNVFMAMGRLDDAIRDYRQAVRLSAPYPEVWTNLGQCYRKMGRMQAAADAYSRALDLDETVEVARVGRAQVLSALGRAAEARVDYEAALARNPAQPLVLMNLAVLRYRAGELQEAVDALDRAVALAPDTPPLYRNRAVALEELGRADEAARDLHTYVTLVPDAPDRGVVEEKIAALAGGLVAA